MNHPHALQVSAPGEREIVMTRVFDAPRRLVFDAFTKPELLKRWLSGLDGWSLAVCEIDLRVGGKFTARMEAKDGSMGFDFAGTYTVVDPNRRIEYAMDDARTVQVEFIEQGTKVVVRETFDAESAYPVEHQRAGWQAILDRFGKHVEAAG